MKKLIGFTGEITLDSRKRLYRDSLSILGESFGKIARRYNKLVANEEIEGAFVNFGFFKVLIMMPDAHWHECKNTDIEFYLSKLDKIKDSLEFHKLFKKGRDLFSGSEWDSLETAEIKEIEKLLNAMVEIVSILGDCKSAINTKESSKFVELHNVAAERYKAFVNDEANKDYVTLIAHIPGFRILKEEPLDDPETLEVLTNDKVTDASPDAEQKNTSVLPPYQKYYPGSSAENPYIPWCGTGMPTDDKVTETSPDAEQKSDSKIEKTGKGGLYFTPLQPRQPTYFPGSSAESPFNWCGTGRDVPLTTDQFSEASPESATKKSKVSGSCGNKP